MLEFLYRRGFRVCHLLADDQTPCAEQPAAFARDHLHLTPVAVRDQPASLVSDFGCDNKDLMFHLVSVQSTSICQGNHCMTNPARLPLLQRRHWRLLFTILPPKIPVDICNLNFM